MTDAVSLELLAFNLKLLARQRRKTILISAGQIEDKERMLPTIRDLHRLDADIYATPGTHRFPSATGVKATAINKIADDAPPNILPFLKDNRFDLVVNILTGDQDYDEGSDARTIPRLSI